jgi:ribosomal RNA-processing protein 1
MTILTTCNNSSTGDIRVPASLAYHIADIYVEELDKVLEVALLPPPAPLAILFEPFFALAARTPTAVTYKRIQDALFEPLFTALVQESYPETEPPKSKRIRLDAEIHSYPHLVANACYSDSEGGPLDGAILKKKLLRRIFEVASHPDTRDSNRRKMYTLWKESYDEGPDEE